MHRIIETELEDYLEGRSTQEFDLHLAQCADCRQELAAVQQVSGLLVEFRSQSAPAASLGFSSRVLRQAQAQQRQSLWGVFRLDPAFGQKLALASLLGLAMLGGYLISAPGDVMAEVDHTPEAVMASHDTTSTDPQAHQNGMLMRLANYHQ